MTISRTQYKKTAITQGTKSHGARNRPPKPSLYRRCRMYNALLYTSKRALCAIRIMYVDTITLYWGNHIISSRLSSTLSSAWFSRLIRILRETPTDCAVSAGVPKQKWCTMTCTIAPGTFFSSRRSTEHSPSSSGRRKENTKPSTDTSAEMAQLGAPLADPGGSYGNS